MKLHTQRSAFRTLGLGVSAAALLLVGCSSEPEPEPVVYTPPPPPPVDLPPPVVSVSELKAQLRIDPRVYMSEEQAPPTTDARKALLEFFDGFARADDQALARLLSDLDRSELKAMVDSGEWKRATEGITNIEVHQTGRSINGDCVLAIFEFGMRYEPQLWYYSKVGDQFVFEAASTPPNMMNRLSGTDWIDSWHQILAEEEELALKPDQPVELPQRNLEESTESGSMPGGDDPTGPAAPMPGF